MTPPRRQLLRQCSVAQCWSGYCPVHARTGLESGRAGARRDGGGTRPREPCGRLLERLVVGERVERHEQALRNLRQNTKIRHFWKYIIFREQRSESTTFTRAKDAVWAEEGRGDSS